MAGLFACCFGPPATQQHASMEPGKPVQAASNAHNGKLSGKDVVEPSTPSKIANPQNISSPALIAEKGEKAEKVTAEKASPKVTSAVATVSTSNSLTDSSQPALSQSLKSLTLNEATAVQGTLMKVSALIQKFAEGRNERTTPVQGLRRALNLVLADCQAKYACVSVLTEAHDCSLVVASVGLPDSGQENTRMVRVQGSGSSVELVLKSGTDFHVWASNSNVPCPCDWQAISSIGLRHISCVTIKMMDKVVGVLTVAFEDPENDHTDYLMWPTYLQLVAASIASMIKDNSIPKHLAMVKELHECKELDSVMHKLVTHLRNILGHTNNHHIWYRVGLTTPGGPAATLFDDLTQVPTSLMQRSLGNPAGSSSFKLLKEVQAAGGVMRTIVPIKNTVLKIAVHNRQQVMIPDVQKVINQSGNVSADIFNTRLIKPPTSVLVYPLRVRQHIYGAVFVMSSVQTDFLDISARVREACDVLAPHLLYMLVAPMRTEYNAIQCATVQPANGSSASTTDSGSGLAVMPRQPSTNASGGAASASAVGGAAASSNNNNSGDSFMYTQSRSSTGALVTGITEKLNQKRIKSSMDFSQNQSMADLQITGLLGEGGFAKVFRGLWRGLVVGAKIVCDDGKNENMVMKNAHEIAILSALSHPNIVQAYSCMTDVNVRELLSICMRYSNQTVLSSPAHKYLLSMEDRTCHIEVIEYCDLGNLSTALKNHIFLAPGPVVSERRKSADGSTALGSSVLGPPATERGHVDIRTLLLTLIEIASAMAYLHRMGVVHCDLKPANVLLKSSNMDSRTFQAKVSDFGLSRVEDDEICSSFPFNSCGTAAYVAPEALICHKKVNSSVDVYAFGILMWEMYTGQRPYGSLKQQQLVEEVVMRGLRPKFPGHTPAGYIVLAQSCWSGSAAARPTFDNVLDNLNRMLQAIDDREMESMGNSSFGSMGEKVEYIQYGGTGKYPGVPGYPGQPVQNGAAFVPPSHGANGGPLNGSPPGGNGHGPAGNMPMPFQQSNGHMASAAHPGLWGSNSRKGFNANSPAQGLSPAGSVGQPPAAAAGSAAGQGQTTGSGTGSGSMAGQSPNQSASVAAAGSGTSGTHPKVGSAGLPAGAESATGAEAESAAAGSSSSAGAPGPVMHSLAPTAAALASSIAVVAA